MVLERARLVWTSLAVNRVGLQGLQGKAFSQSVRLLISCRKI